MFMDDQKISANAPQEHNGVAMPTFRRLLEQSWATYRKHFWVMIWAIALPFIAYSILIGLVGYLAHLVFVQSTPSLLQMISALFLIVLLIIAGLFTVMWGELATIQIVKERRHAVTLRHAFKKTWGKVLPAWGITFYMGFLESLGFVLFIIPGIIAYGAFALSIYAMMGDDVYGWRAIAYSARLVRGRWWYVLGKLLSIIVLFMVVYLVGSAALRFNQTAVLAFQSLAMFFGLPLMLAYLYLLYEHLRQDRGPEKLAAAKAGSLRWYYVGLVASLIIVPAAILFFAWWHLMNSQPFSHSLLPGNPALLHLEFFAQNIR